MTQKICRETIELLFASISHDSDCGLLSSFMFSKPDGPFGHMGAGTEIYYHPTRLTKAALFVRTNGPAYLKYLSIGDIWSMLQKFLTKNYWYLADEAMFARFKGNYSEHISEKTKAQFADLLASSRIFNPPTNFTLFPLLTITGEATFETGLFFIAPAAALSRELLSIDIDEDHFLPERFPPLKDWGGKSRMVTSWLGVRSPAVQVSIKMRSAILGALALKHMYKHRYMFSGRDMYGGNCSFEGNTSTYSFGEPHTPPLMYDIIIDASDLHWLETLSEKLSDNRKVVRREIKALEYFYRAWPLETSERFPILCMTLDAIFGEANHATQAVIDGVRHAIGSHVEDKRLRQLMDLRASVIHGGAPDVFDSKKYAKYYEAFEADPLRDLEQVVAACLNAKIFDNAIKPGKDPNEKLIREGQAKGRFPRKPFEKSILDAE